MIRSFLYKKFNKLSKSIAKRLKKLSRFFRGLKFYKVKKEKNSYLIIAILRIRNEELILQDTLDHLADFCDGIVVYDDASTDKTVKIAKNHKKVLSILRNKKWEGEISKRLLAETEQRRLSLKEALKYSPEWIFCADADERYIGDIRKFASSAESKNIDGVRVSLFDAYMTKDDCSDYRGGKLINFRDKYGPERRDILMMWRSDSNAYYVGLDKREPSLESKRICTKFYCQHYGKSISISQWEETCEYYSKHFPYETYGKKWDLRRGMAIHKKSDFDTDLFRFNEELFNNAIKTHPSSPSILFTTHFLKGFTGSELAIYDLAREFLARGYEVAVGSFENQMPLIQFFEEINVRIIDLKNIDSEYFDFVWSQHFTTIELIVAKGLRAKKIIFSSLSPYEPLESPPLCIDKISLFLANSDETKDALCKMGVSQDEVMIFPNPASHEYFEDTEPNIDVKKPKKIAVVSNRIQSEIEECAKILAESGVIFDFFGFYKNVKMITPQILKEYDLVITIGRTVQYCLAMGKPVYCYDRFGGPGYIVEENMQLARYYNFSGRCVKTQRSSEDIALEIMSKFEEAVKNIPFNKKYAKENFCLKSNVDSVLSRINNQQESDLVKNIKARQGIFYSNNPAS